FPWVAGTVAGAMGRAAGSLGARGAGVNAAEPGRRVRRGGCAGPAPGAQSGRAPASEQGHGDGVMTTVALANARVLTDEGFRDDVAVLVENGRIAGLVPPEHADADQGLDLDGGFLLPGFI